MADAWILANTKQPQLHFPLTLSVSVCFFLFSIGPWILLSLRYFLSLLFYSFFISHVWRGCPAEDDLSGQSYQPFGTVRITTMEWRMHTHVHTAMQTWMYTQTDGMTRPLCPGTHTSVKKTAGGSVIQHASRVEGWNSSETAGLCSILSRVDFV